jgi:AhpD family alkylhydroperoxidase
MQSGFGPFVAVLLADEKWTQQNIGLVLSFLKSLTVELSKCTIPSGECIEGSLADALLRDPHYLSRRKHQTTGVFADGALPAKTKQVIAVAVAHVTQCPYCIKGHTKAALRHGATPEELMEAIWVAAEMRAGGAYAHSAVSLVAMGESADRAPSG